MGWWKIIRSLILSVRLLNTLLIKCSHYRYLNLPDCKVASKSKLYSYYIAASKIIYLSYNIYRNNLSVLRKVLDEKKRLNVKERETALFLYDTASKLLHLKD